MEKRKLKDDIKKEIIELYNNGTSQTKIVEYLKEKYNIDISQQAISNMIKNYKDKSIVIKDNIIEIDNKIIENKIYQVLKELLEKLPIFLSQKNYGDILKSILNAYIELRKLESEPIVNNNLVGVKIEFIKDNNNNEPNND